MVQSEKVRYQWNDKVGNFCLMRKQKQEWVFVEPIEPLRLRNITNKIEFAECLQNVYYRRTGKIDENIGINDGSYDLELAKKLDCY